MTRFIVRRLLSGAVLLLAVSIATFFLARLSISDPTLTLLGTGATDAQREALALRIGLDQPLAAQFWDWFSRAVTGDFGESWKGFTSVNKELAVKVPVTLSVIVFATVLSAVFGTIAGVISGLFQGGVMDRIVKYASVLLYALPGFWLSFVLITWFAVQLKWFPAVGYVLPTTSFFGWLGSITLPAVSLALGAIVMIAEQLRNSIIQNSGKDYVRTLRSRGLSEARVITHLVRNSAPEALAVLAVLFVGLLSGAVVVETIFALPGIGMLANAASLIGDMPTLMGITVVSILIVIVVNALLDLTLGWLNPKVRVS